MKTIFSGVYLILQNKKHNMLKIRRNLHTTQLHNCPMFQKLVHNSNIIPKLHTFQNKYNILPLCAFKWRMKKTRNRPIVYNKKTGFSYSVGNNNVGLGIFNSN